MIADGDPRPRTGAGPEVTIARARDPSPTPARRAANARCYAIAARIPGARAPLRIGVSARDRAECVIHGLARADRSSDPPPPDDDPLPLARASLRVRARDKDSHEPRSPSSPRRRRRRRSRRASQRVPSPRHLVRLAAQRVRRVRSLPQPRDLADQGSQGDLTLRSGSKGAPRTRPLARRSRSSSIDQAPKATRPFGLVRRSRHGPVRWPRSSLERIRRRQ